MRRLIAKTEDEIVVENSVSMMRLTNEQEKAISEGTTFFDYFNGTDLRRTEIACATWACQNMCGSAFMGYSTYFYQNAGLPTEQAFNFTMVQYVLGLIGNIITWTLMAHAGRRTLYF
jgi:MFS transporter, SP family, general alpha glucoside:H+ symporter